MNINVQDVFNKVICSGRYGLKYGSCLMCLALRVALENEEITDSEYKVAIREIKKYLGGFGSLGGFLYFKGHDGSFETRLDIYLNWENKPKF